MPGSVFSAAASEASAERAIQAQGYAGTLGYFLCQGACCKGVRQPECKWCHLPRSTVNRLQHNQNPHLAWRRPRGLECAVCPFVIASAPRWATVAKDELLKKLGGQGEEYDNFMDARKAWEDKKNIDPKSRETAMRQAGGRSKVVAKQTDMLQTSERLGNLWPTTLYMKTLGKKPARKDIVKIMHQGRLVAGVVLDDTHGTPVGSIALSSISQNAAERQTTLKTSDEVLGEEELDRAFTHASERQRVVAKQGKNNDGTTKDAVSLKIAPSKSNGDDSSDGDGAILDSLWQTPLVGKKGKGKKVADSGDDDAGGQDD